MVVVFLVLKGCSLGTFGWLNIVAGLIAGLFSVHIFLLVSLFKGLHTLYYIGVLSWCYAGAPAR